MKFVNGLIETLKKDPQPTCYFVDIVDKQTVLHSLQLDEDIFKKGACTLHMFPVFLKPE